MAHQTSPLVAGVSGLAVGAGLMFVLDPARGRTRRAFLRGKLVRAEHELAGASRVAAHDLANRARGLGHELATVVRPDDADDDVLGDRVRARLGHAIDHPGGVEVSAKAGAVTLSGPVLASEVGELLRTVRLVRGVHAVINNLDVREEAGSVNALKGERRHGRARLAPSTKLIIAVGIGALAGARALRLAC